jgi:uncharacterized phage infection (PIP) family protein YhgE
MNDHIGEANEMSDTLRTDAEAFYPHDSKWKVCDADFARQLERELNDGIDRIKRLIAERDTARQQADQKHSLREEFRELLATDDIEQGVAVVRDLKQLAEVRLGYIKQLTTDIERLTAKVAQLYEGAEEQKQGIKRLEDAGDALSKIQTYDLIQNMNWRKAKEAK